MKETGLAQSELELMRGVFRRVPVIREVVLYGSRAQGTHRPESDIDLALVGVEDEVQAEAVAEELEELPLPYRFDVKAISAISYTPLQEHLARVGIVIYRRAQSALGEVAK